MAAHRCAAAHLVGLAAVCRAGLPAVPIPQFISLVPLSRSILEAPRQAACRPAISGASARSICAAASPGKKQLVFLGTPEVAALVLQKLLDASQLPGASFEVAAVVAQPSRPRGRKRLLQPSPVERQALDCGFPTARILCPERAGDAAFLDTLRSLGPDLCVTAAYGNYLPAAFLSIPRHGTLNIHPSLLPAYRGAAPVQRSLQDGVSATGVTVLYSVKEMDAGPVLAQQAVEVGPDIQAPELLHRLFSLGSELLLSKLGAVWDGTAPQMAVAQDAAAATQAPKLTREEGLLDFLQPAAVCHDKVRGFAGWPGTYHTFRISAAGGGDASGGGEAELELKVLRTRVAGCEARRSGSGVASGEVEVVDSALRVVCGDGRVLEIVELQAPGKRPVAARDFANGLKGRTLHWQRASSGLVAA